MELKEFDASLGGSEHLPNTANSLKIAAARSVEIAAMTESITNPSKVRLVFQSLPVHMRRRVMSHNSKRLPTKLRIAHLEQLKKSGLPPKQQSSRKHRRRPQNLLAEYNRRKINNAWLETHIWHAKRFHMTNRWGHRLAEAPCDKVFRACYRATSKHCLLQDISYYTPIKITGTFDIIKDMFSVITHGSCGPTVGAKFCVDGTRHVQIHLYEPDKYPLNYIGKALCLWEPSEGSHRTMWLFVHPSQSKQIEMCFNDLLSTVNKESESNVKRQKICNSYAENISIEYLPGAFNRFRLTGPNSQAVLLRSLKCINDIEHIKSNVWVEKYTRSNKLYLKEKEEYWKSISPAQSPAQLSPRIIVGLIVRDPRLMRPSHRTKAESNNSYMQMSREALTQISTTTSTSPLWSTDIHQEIKSKVKTNGQFIEHVTKLNLVPGEIYENDTELQSVPVVLTQRPGSQDSSYKKLGYGSGWDIIVPSGYGLAFWQTFIMFGARPGGIRETESMTFEMGECYLPPDSEAGRTEHKRIESELKDKYFRQPPKKRVNYLKLGINSPFSCQWEILLKEWAGKPTENFCVLRDWRILDDVKECLKKKMCLPEIKNANSSLVAVYLQLNGGDLQKHALICFPKPGDVANVKSLFEANHKDPNAALRKEKRIEHAKTLKRLRKRRVKCKKKATIQRQLARKTGIILKDFQKQDTEEKKPKVKHNKEPSEYMKLMRELWLPSNISSVRNYGSRETMGYVTHGAFSFTESRSCGVGYVTYNALNALVKSNQNQVLVRNPTSNKYNLAKMVIIQNGL